MSNILGEPNPGFNLWTSAHGFHHIPLTQSTCWKVFWGILVTLSSIALIACIIYHFYYVFSFAVYTRILMENPDEMNWPTTIVCDRQIFSYSKLVQIQSMTPNAASILSWSICPMLSRPEIANDTTVLQTETTINDILSRYNAYPTPYTKLFEDMAPNCTQLILQCSFGNVTYSGYECCAKYFNPTPHFTMHGTCFTTRGAPERRKITVAGDASAFSIVTMHDSGNSFTQQYASDRIYNQRGLNFAVVDDSITVEAAMKEKALSVQPGNYASVGLTKSVIDNRDLEWSAIAPMQCITPGSKGEAFWNDADLLFGVNPDYGYSKAACAMISKVELLAREKLGCTFNPSPQDTYKRCNANQSAEYKQMFLDRPTIPMNIVDSSLKSRVDKKCLSDCLIEKYATSTSYSSLSQTELQNLQQYMTQSGQAITGSNPGLVSLKLYLNTMEYQHLQNFPQPGVQFVAELGGLMCFFLGISIISVIECLCYCLCCGCRKNSDDD